MTVPVNALGDMRPVSKSLSRTNRFYFRLVQQQGQLWMWEVLYRDPEEPTRFGVALGDVFGCDASLFAVGQVFMTFADTDVQTIVTAHIRLTKDETEELSRQSEVVVREAALRTGQLLEIQ